MRAVTGNYEFDWSGLNNYDKIIIIITIEVSLTVVKISLLCRAVT